MKFVTDTHTLLWYLQDSPRLGGASKRMFDEGRGSRWVVIPTIVLAELLYISRKLVMPVPFDKIMKSLEKDKRFEIYPLSTPIIQESVPLVRQFEIHDALIVSTALHLDIPLMTHDGEVRRSALVRTFDPYE